MQSIDGRSAKQAPALSVENHTEFTLRKSNTGSQVRTTGVSRFPSKAVSKDPPCGLAGSSLFSLMAHSIYAASFSPALALSIPRFTSHAARFTARPVLRPVRTAQKLSLSPRRPILVVNSALSLSTPVIKPDDHWSMWTALFSFAAFGIWSSFPPFSLSSIFEFWQKSVEVNS